MLLIQGVELRVGERCYACRNEALRQSLITHGSVYCDVQYVGTSGKFIRSHFMNLLEAVS